MARQSQAGEVGAFGGGGAVCVWVGGVIWVTAMTWEPWRVLTVGGGRAAEENPGWVERSTETRLYAFMLQRLVM